MVRAALAALVSRFGDGLHAGGGTADRVDAVSAETISHCMLFSCDAVGDFDYCYGELYVSELFGVAAGRAAAGRPISGMGRAAVVPRVDSRKEPDRCGWCDGSSTSAHEHWGGMARTIYAAAQRVRGLVPWIGLLFHDGAAALDVRAGTAAV